MLVHIDTGSCFVGKAAVQSSFSRHVVQTFVRKDMRHWDTELYIFILYGFYGLRFEQQVLQSKQARQPYDRKPQSHSGAHLQNSADSRIPSPYGENRCRGGSTSQEEPSDGDESQPNRQEIVRREGGVFLLVVLLLCMIIGREDKAHQKSSTG